MNVLFVRELKRTLQLERMLTIRTTADVRATGICGSDVHFWKHGW